MKKFFLFFSLFFVCAALLISCSGSNKSGEINFKINKADLENLIKIYKDTSNGDIFTEEETYRALEVYIKGDWSQKKVIVLSEEEDESYTDISCSFDDIPAGSIVYADVDYVEYDSDNPDGQIWFYGYSDRFSVVAGNNYVNVTTWSNPNPDIEREYEYSCSEADYTVRNEENPDGKNLGSELKYCFGNDYQGSIWFLQTDGVYPEYVYNLKTQESFEIKDQQKSMLNTFVSVDPVSGFSYLCGFESNAETGSIESFSIYDCGYSFDNLNSENTDLILNQIFNTDEFLEYNIKAFAVNGNNFYLLLMKYGDEEKTEYWLYTVKKIVTYEDTGENISWNKIRTKLDFYKYFTGSEYEEIFRDMIFYEGKLYFLLGKNACEYVDDVQSYYSCGCLVKYDPVSEKMTSLGLSGEKILQKDYENKKVNGKDIGISVYINDTTDYYNDICENNSRISYENGNKLIFNKSVTVDGSKYSPKNYLPNLYTPAPLSSDLYTKNFYGPYKFIGLKPRRLVISDDGVAFYTDDDGALSAKNVNRKVTVNLADFSIEDISETDACFEEDYAPNARNGLGITKKLEVENKFDFFKNAFDLSESDRVLYNNGQACFWMSDVNDKNIFFGVTVSEE